MSKPSPFKKLFDQREQEQQIQSAAAPLAPASPVPLPAESLPVAEAQLVPDQPGQYLADSAVAVVVAPVLVQEESEMTAPAQEALPGDSVVVQSDSSEAPKRGRPATGKRSRPDWIGRTYYIQKSTDLCIESELLELKRRGEMMDKSELVNALLQAWVQWHQGADMEALLREISSR